MEEEHSVLVPTSDGAPLFAVVDVAGFEIPRSTDVILIARHYYPAFGGLQNFTARLAVALQHLGYRTLVVSLNEPPNTKAHLRGPVDQLAPEVHVISKDRSLFWHRLPNVLRHDDSATTILAVGLEQEENVSAQLSALAEIANSGRTSILRIATTGDFASRVDARLLEACKQLHAIVVLNSAMQAEVEAVFSDDSRCLVQRIPVIGCALDDPTDTSMLRQKWRRQQNIASSAFVALWAGRPVRRKRLQKLIRIWHNSCVEGVLVLAGVDPDAKSQEVRDLIGWLREHAYIDIRLVPPISPYEMTSLYAAADCFLFTSKREGMSNAVVEALSRGLPVLASDIPGVRDILAFHENAALQLFTDIQEADFVRALRDEAAKYVSTGQQCRQRDPEAQRVFGAKAIAKRYISLFELLRQVSRHEATRQGEQEQRNKNA